MLIIRSRTMPNSVPMPTGQLNDNRHLGTGASHLTTSSHRTCACCALPLFKPWHTHTDPSGTIAGLAGLLACAPCKHQHTRAMISDDQTTVSKLPIESLWYYCTTSVASFGIAQPLADRTHNHMLEVQVFENHAELFIVARTGLIAL